MSLDEAYLDFTEHLEKRQSWPDSLRTHHYCASSNSKGRIEPSPLNACMHILEICLITLRNNLFFCKGDESNELPQETTPDSTDLSPVLFDDSPSSPLCCEDAGSAFEIFGTSVEEAVREMRFRIEQKTLLTASAGEGKLRGKKDLKTLLISVIIFLILTSMMIGSYVESNVKNLPHISRNCSQYDACQSVQ